MGRLRIEDLAGRSYRELSGGQQQRVLLARSLLAAHEILMLDEPVTGLEPAAAAELYETLRTLNREDGMTIIMVTHDINSAVVNSSKILHVSGETVFFLRNLLNPKGFLKKVKFVVTNPDEEPSEEDSYEKQIQSQDDV